tara:strand:+ start:1188 stop:1676 length:489 start_codon:yes stop_codon:yes gene_type:complete
MIYIFLILFFSFLILNQLLNTTIEGLAMTRVARNAAEKAKKAQRDAEKKAKDKKEAEDREKNLSDVEAKQASNLKDECDKMSNVDCANLVTEENKGIIARISKIAKAISDGADNSADAQKKREAQVQIDTARKQRIKAATSGENVVNSPLMDKAIDQSKVPK